MTTYYDNDSKKWVATAVFTSGILITEGETEEEAVQHFNDYVETYGL